MAGIERLLAPRAYTPRVRRLLCIAALIGRFCSQAYVWRISPPPRPVPIEWQLPADSTNGTLPAWWLAR
jgi:hypothetical protein